MRTSGFRVTELLELVLWPNFGSLTFAACPIASMLPETPTHALPALNVTPSDASSSSSSSSDLADVSQFGPSSLLLLPFAHAAAEHPAISNETSRQKTDVRMATCHRPAQWSSAAIESMPSPRDTSSGRNEAAMDK